MVLIFTFSKPECEEMPIASLANRWHSSSSHGFLAKAGYLNTLLPALFFFSPWDLIAWGVPAARQLGVRNLNPRFVRSFQVIISMLNVCQKGLASSTDSELNILISPSCLGRQPSSVPAEAAERFQGWQHYLSLDRTGTQITDYRVFVCWNN